VINEVGNEESCSLINPGRRGAACCWSESPGAAANESSPDRLLVYCSPGGLLARIEAFRLGLRDLGYVEGKNIVIEYRSAEGKPDQLAGLAAELVHLKVDLIVSSGPTATPAAKEATSTIPIVMGFDSDPVANGFATSLARPGRNITGLSTRYRFPPSFLNEDWLQSSRRRAGSLQYTTHQNLSKTADS